MKTERRKIDEIIPDPRDHALTTFDRPIHPIKLVDDKDKMGSWLKYGQVERLEEQYHWLESKKLLSSDPVLKIMEVQLIVLLRVPRSTHVSQSNMLEAIRGLMQLLQDAGFAAGSFNANAILERDLE